MKQIPWAQNFSTWFEPFIIFWTQKSDIIAILLAQRSCHQISQYPSDSNLPTMMHTLRCKQVKQFVSGWRISCFKPARGTCIGTARSLVASYCLCHICLYRRLSWSGCLSTPDQEPFSPWNVRLIFDQPGFFWDQLNSFMKVRVCQ